jgi:hypothetical protein
MVTHMINFIQLHDKKLGIEKNMNLKDAMLKGIDEQINHNIIFGLFIGCRSNTISIKVDKGM